MRRPSIRIIALSGFLLAGIGWSQGRRFGNIDNFFGGLSRGAYGYKENVPPAEFRVARIKYATNRTAGSRGISQPMWAVDYPQAEEHLFNAVRRVTNIDVAEDSIHLELSDERIFEYPFLFLQQPGQGNWRPTPDDAANLREHLTRGGFMLVDDFHGEYDWAVFQTAMRKVFPDRPIVEIPDDDPVLHIFYDVDEKTSIPGERHLGYSRSGEIAARMEGPPHWRGIYDEQKRLMVAMNFNMDMGDAWEHADDPYYPVPMTALAYKFGINYIIYAMTH